MNSTFEIVGPSASAGKTTTGTVFILGKGQKEDPKKAYFVLITAAHVLDEIAGDDTTLILRKKDERGLFSKFPYPIKIRRQRAKLYVTNPNADVAAMYTSLPAEIDLHLLPIEFLVEDDTLERIEIHPGDELLCLGFPLIVDFDGFPILRTGTLASYPITPSRTVKHYIFAFHVFPGNSGGPVYYSFSNRIFGGMTNIGIEQGVIGLVSQQVNSSVPEYKDLPLDVAIVIPSSIIRETVALLPATPYSVNRFPGSSR